VVLHAQPLRLVFLSHLPDVTTTLELTERLMRWEPETMVVAPDGVELAAFQVPGSPGQMAATVEALARSSAVVWAKHGIVTRSDVSATQAADLVEYIEAAATYEVMNLNLGSVQRSRVARARACRSLRSNPSPPRDPRGSEHTSTPASASRRVKRGGRAAPAR